MTTTYRITSARLIAQSYGAYCNPDDRFPAHILAEGVPDLATAQLIQSALDEVHGSWSGDYSTAASAMNCAVRTCNAELGNGFQIGTASGDYREIVVGGETVGHETVSWLFATVEVGGEPDTTPVSKIVYGQQGNFDYGLVACVFVAVYSVDYIARQVQHDAR